MLGRPMLCMLLCIRCRALRPLINVFGGRQLLLMADAALHWIGDQGAVINCPEPPTAVELDKGMEDDLRRFHWGHDVEAPQRMQCIAAGLTMLHKVLTIRNIWQSPKVGATSCSTYNTVDWLYCNKTVQALGLNQYSQGCPWLLHVAHI